MAKLQITIDDGPDPITSALQPMLNELDKRKVTAAFFVLGQEVKANPRGAKLILERGHVLGNHSWDHLEKRTSMYNDVKVLDQFNRTHEEVKKATNTTMQFWRAPRLEEISRLSRLLVGPGKLYKMSHNDSHADSKDSLDVTDAKGMLAAITSTIQATRGRTTFRLLFHVKEVTAKAFPVVLDGLIKEGHELVNFAQDA